MNIKEVKWITPGLYCLVLGLQFRDRFDPRLYCFATREEFVEYCDTLMTIYEPHERPITIFIQYINKNAE